MEVIFDVIYAACALSISYFICRWLYRNTPDKKEAKVEGALGLLTDAEKEAARKTTRMEKQMYNLLNYDGSKASQVDLEDEE